jgi:uncharacterized protein (DUF58 family)
VLAGVVAFTVVPYLAGRVATERLRKALEFEFTREGAVYLATTLIIGVAALNTGNNLLFIIVSAMLAAIVASGVASAVVLRGLDLDVRVPQHVFAFKPTSIRFDLKNEQALPSFSISVVPPRTKPTKKFEWRTERSRFGFPPSKWSRKQWLSLPDVALKRVAKPGSTEQQWMNAPVYFPFIPGKSAVAQELEITFPARGEYQQHALGLSTRFPFSFLRKTRMVSLNEPITVYPSVAETEQMLELLPTFTGEFEAFVAGRGNDLYRIRPYVAGDMARNIDWKASARSVETMTREFSREDERKLRVIFDNPEIGKLSATKYEEAVQLAASLAWRFADGSTELAFFAETGREYRDVFDMLRYLATVQPGEQQSPVLDLLSRVPSDDYNLILTARRRGTIPGDIWAHSYCIFLAEL